MIKKLLAALLLLITNVAAAQYYSSGSDPARLHWQQINTPTVRLVFEKNMAKEAAKLAAYIDSMTPYISYSLKHKAQKIDILLHNHSAYSNGLVSWAPKRSEFFTIPGQETNSVEWLKHLAIHEYRHVVQIDKLNQGFTKGLTWFFGQQATGAVLGLYLPMWLLEGDAVIAETALTQSGRGRSFAFNNELKAQILGRGIYSYQKAYMGSYKDYVPNYYKMGYLLTAKAREIYGPQLWENSINYVGRNSWNPRAFNKAIKQNTGLGQKKLYLSIFKQLKEEWSQEMSKQTQSSYSEIKATEDEYLLYRSAIAINDSTLISSVSGPGIRSGIVSIDIPSGKTSILAYTGARDSELISANSRMVAWSEIRNHPRWDNESWSLIRTLDLESGKSRFITRKSYLYSPALHPSQNIIAAVESSSSNQYSLSILDAHSGQRLKQISTPANSYPITPSWNMTGDNIVLILLSDKGKAIFTLDPQHESWRQVSPWGYQEPRDPIQNGNIIYFVAQGDYSDEIYSYKLSSGEKQRLTATAFGAYYPSLTPEANTLIYSTYSAKGLRPVMHTASDKDLQPQSVPSLVMQLAEAITSHESAPIEPSASVEQKDYSAQSYSKWNIFNLHSWAPVMLDFDDETIYTGISAMSQNLLGTSVFTAGYNANPSYKHQKYYLDYSYRGLFPIFNLTYRFGDSDFERKGYFTDDEYVYHADSELTVWNHYLKAGIRLPFDLSRGAWSRHISTSSRLSWQWRSELTYPMTQYIQSGNFLIPTGNIRQNIIPLFNYYGLEHNLNFQNIRRGSSRDVGTRMGQALSLFYNHSPFGNISSGSISGFMSRLYLPGASRFHSISIHNDFQNKIPGDRVETDDDYLYYYRPNNVISFPRGYSNVENDRMYLFRATYSLPLWNPDLTLGKLAYIKRIRLNAFYDMADAEYSLIRKDSGQKESYHLNPQSYGVELLSDTHLFRFILPFTIGGRLGYRSLDKAIFGEFIISSALGGFMVN